MLESRRPDRWILPATLVAFMALLFALWRMEGLHMDKEALKYTGCAEQVLRGDLHDLFGNYLAYATYVLFLLPFVALGAPILAIPVQIGLSVIAALALGRLTERISGHRVAGQLATALFLLSVPVQVWTLALYTESLFTTLTVLLAEQLLARDRPGRWTWPLVVLMLFARPVGLLFVGPLLITGLGRMWPPGLRLAGYAGVLFLALLNPRVARPQLDIIVNSDVLCGCTEDTGRLTDFHGHSVLDAQLHLIGRNGSGPHLKLMGARMASLFTFTRSAYSTTHNQLLAGYFLLYPFALAGCWMLRRSRPIGTVAAILVLHAILIGCTCDEWSGRFLAPLVPLLIIPVCTALDRLLPFQRS
ncbi:MAG: hypothetical protein IT229_03660 [Flavobacteriales bacterium]|nr:hypothetical protein [Flavobacteriales bacterium]